MRTAAPFRDSRRRLGWLMLLVAAVLVRGIAPEGWMPVADAAGGIEITLCDGQGPMQVMVMTKDGHVHKAPVKAPLGDHPCAFAGMGVASAPPPLPAIIAPPRPAAADLPTALSAATPGHGLAAPPPPATGPPALV